MRILVISLVILAMTLTGCVGYSEPEPSYTPYEPPVDTVEPAPVPETPEPATPASEPTTIDDQKPPDNITWVSPGKVMIGNFHAGARAEYPVTIHNGKDTTTEFLVYYKQPSSVGEEYGKAPSVVQDWVVIIDSTPVLEPRETKDILVVLEMPESAKDPEPKWEFWIAVKDNSQTGLIQTELCVRWLVAMRGS